MPEKEFSVKISAGMRKPALLLLRSLRRCVFRRKKLFITRPYTRPIARGGNSAVFFPVAGITRRDPASGPGASMKKRYIPRRKTALHARLTIAPDDRALEPEFPVFSFSGGFYPALRPPEHIFSGPENVQSRIVESIFSNCFLRNRY